MWTLDRILGDCTGDEFLHNVLGHEFRHFKGVRGRFQSILPWSELNRVLQEHRMEWPRIRVVRDGVTEPAESYLRFAPTRRGPLVPSVDAGKLMNHLQLGANLVVDAIQEMVGSIGEVSSALERELGEHVQVNCYSAFGDSQGFDLHWDDHDVLILQVSGRKYWIVYSYTRPSPMHTDINPNATPPTEPVWEGFLEDGEVLYIPRGWWHVACAKAESTLHLTFGFFRKTGIDLVKWVTDQLHDSEVFRRDLPRFGSEAEKAERIDQLRDEIARMWTPELMAEFFSVMNAAAQDRASVSLPYTLAGNAVNDDPSLIFRLNSPRQLEVVERNGAVELNAMGKTWSFATAALPILTALTGSARVSLGEMIAACPELDSADVRGFLEDLIAKGLVAAVSPQTERVVVPS